MMLERALGLYEIAKTDAIQQMLKPGQTFIDVGVNKGDFSLLGAKLVGPEGRVLAFEPEADNCDWIRKSITLNGYDNVDLHEIALSDEEGTAELHIGDRSGFHTLVPGQARRSNKGTVSIRTRPLDAVLAELGVEQVDMMKIDVEGADMQVLRGAQKTLVDNRDLILLIDIHPNLGVDPFEVCGFLQDRGFSCFRMLEPYDKLAKVGPKLEEILARRV